MKKRNLILGLILADIFILYYIVNIFENRGLNIGTVVRGLLAAGFTVYIHLLIKNKSYKKVLITIGIAACTLPLISLILWLGLKC